MEHSGYAKRKLIWRNILFFVFTTLVALVGCPLYLLHYGISPSIIGLTAFFMVATGMSITVGYHRLFAHATFKAHPVVRFLLLFFGAAAFQQAALEWSAQHRDHHRYVDTDRDPYDIKKGFFYAHIGWLIFWEHVVDFDNAHDLAKDPMVAHQNKHYFAWCIVAGVITPVLIGALMGHALGAFLFAVCLRITLVYHSTFCINSVCHMFGTATYDPDSSAKDNWLSALATNGEGYHNFHHRFPSDYRNGVRWYHFDPSKWLIKGLATLGLTWDLKQVSDFRILAARLYGENVRVTKALALLQKHEAEKLQAQLVWTQRYEAVRRNLTEWQTQFESYQALARERMSESSHELRVSARKNMKEARRKFKTTHIQWKELTRKHPVHLQGLLLAGIA